MNAEEFVKREQEVREAVSIYPELEIGEAYRKYKEAKGEKASILHTADPALQAAKRAVLQVFRRPCSQPGCQGTQLLEGVCEGCVEGKKGFKSKWTCEECMFRELSTRPYLDWYNELSKKEVEN